MWYVLWNMSTMVARINCDLKPSNYLLNEDVVAHLSDFGISKLFSQDENVSHTKTLGTLGYTAPGK